MDFNPLVKINEIEHPTVTVFLAAREHVSYYSSLKHMATKRNFYKDLIPSLEAVVEALAHPLNRKRVDELLVFLKNNRKHPKLFKGRPQDSSEAAAATKAKRLFPAECGLLKVGSELTFELLTQLKRAAIMAYHPDRGGDHETMIKVEPAYLLIHDLLCYSLAEEVGEETFDLGFNPVSFRQLSSQLVTEDYHLAFTELLLKVLIDDWNLPTAYRVGMQLSELHKSERGAKRRYDTSPLIRLYCNLAEHIYLTGRHSDAEQALQFAKELLGWSKGELFHSRLVENAEAVVAGKRAVRAVFTHERQARNAYSNSAISEKRLKNALDRFGGHLQNEDLRAAQLSQYAKAYGFLQNLPDDPSPPPALELSGQRVPEPDYFETDVRTMTEAQQSEYHLAFSEGTMLELVRKYTHVRLTSLLRSIIVFDEEVSLDDAKRECYFLEDCQPNKKSGWAKKVAQLIEYFDSLPQDERRERLLLLKQLDANAHEQFAAFSLEGVSHRVGLYPQYMVTARLSVDSLKRSVRTNKVSSVDAHLYSVVDHLVEPPQVLAVIETPVDTSGLTAQTGKLFFEADKVEQEQVNAAKIWHRDLAVVKELGKLDMIGVLITVEGQPEKIVEQLIPYCERLFEVGTRITHVQELQLGFWIDRLTVNLVRLKRWSEAKSWLERYFSLPDRYRQRSTPAKDERMLKRLQRCEKVRKHI